MIGTPITTDAPTFETASGSGANDAVVTIAAATGIIHVLDFLTFSYANNVATATTVTVEAPSGTTLWACGVAANAAEEPQIEHVVFPGGLHGVAGAALIVTVGHGGAGNTTYLSVGYR